MVDLYELEKDEISAHCTGSEWVKDILLQSVRETIPDTALSKDELPNFIQKWYYRDFLKKLKSFKTVRNSNQKNTEHLKLETNDNGSEQIKSEKESIKNIFLQQVPTTAKQFIELLPDLSYML